MMKTLKILLLAISISLVGCTDLVEEPVGVLSPEGVFQSTEDIELAVNGAYAHAINEEIWGRKLSIALMLRSDMVALQSTQTRRVEMDTHTITDDNEMVYDPWQRIYQGIAAANLAISAGDVVDAVSEVENPIVAQAYFIRAFYYFHLVRLFGDVPYIDEVVNSENLEELSSVSCSSEAEVYDNIIADLEFAEEWLPDSVDNRDRPSKAAAKSYLALVYLTMAGTDNGEYFQLAYDKAKEVIDNKGTYNVDLDPDFQTLFNAELIDNSIEPIFALDYNNVEAADNAYDQTAPMTGVRSDDDDQGWSVAVPSMAVYDSFNPDDYRTRVSFQTEATINEVTVQYNECSTASIEDGGLGYYLDMDGICKNDVYDEDGNFVETVDAPVGFLISGHEHAASRPYIAKYTRYPGEYARVNKRATSHNYSMMRYAEVLLIAAEAGVEIGAGDALSLLNEVRARARNGGNSTNGGYVPETIPASTVPADLTSITVEDVLEERRIELAFEGKRWYDIKRRQLGDVVFSATGYEGEKSEWDSSVDYDTPIPQDEINANPNLTN